MRSHPTGMSLIIYNHPRRVTADQTMYIIIIYPNSAGPEVLCDSKGFKEEFDAYQAAVDYAENFEGITNYAVYGQCTDLKNLII